MKKFGKYEKMRKNAIMKTYVTSLLCLVLCVSMFFGTSFAWFTSEVNNTNNEIYIGTLDVDLFKQGASDNEWLDLASSDTNKVKLFNSNIRWEPGYTTLETIKIVNKGDLAFNYVLNFTETPAETPKDETATQSVETTTLNIMDVAKFFDVWVYTHSEEKPFTKPASYDVITAADSGWTSVGSLDKLLAGDAVLSGAMEVKDVRYPQSTESSAAAEGAESSTKPAINDKTTDGKPSEVTYTIALHMKEEATAEVMGFKLSLNVKLIAYQKAAEEDGFGNKYYDNIKIVSDTKELQDALDSGDTDLYLPAGEYKMPSSGTTGEVTITGTKDAVLDVTQGAYMDSADGVTIEGVSIKTSTGMANGNGADYAALYAKDVTYVNCTFVGPMRVGRDGAKFINCTFTELGNDYVWTYGNDVTFEGCTFNTDGKAILIYSDGGSEVSQVSVKNCVFNSTQGAKAGAIANQNCAAIEIHNYGNGVNLTTSGNTYDSNFSGEWRIKTYETGKPKVFVNGTEYATIALDGKTMTIDTNKNVTVKG